MVDQLLSDLLPHQHCQLCQTVSGLKWEETLKNKSKKNGLLLNTTKSKEQNHHAVSVCIDGEETEIVQYLEVG